MNFMELRLSASRLDLLPRSPVRHRDTEYALAQTPHGPQLAVLAQSSSKVLEEFEGESSDFENGTLYLCPLDPANAAALRGQLPWLNPRVIGLATSAGFGDRLGIATPGHVRAVSETHDGVAPIFAQQSIRELQRTDRTPQQVIDAALWGIFEEGWQVGFGADADHLKTRQDIDAFLAAGFTFFTLDPSDYVDDQVDHYGFQELRGRVERLPVHLQPEATGLLGKTIDVERIKITFNEQVLLKAVIKYAKAIDHIDGLFRHLQEASSHPFEVEISMDETDRPTSPAEHIYIASELHRLGVNFISFAPRFIGSFEKGVDYIGDLPSFEDDLAIQAAIARQFGPYKLSLHSGSDKFSIYPAFVHQTKGLAHLKTCGTSYLEALRTVAAIDPVLFQEIYRFSLEHFEADKKTYHISAQTSRAPKPGEVRDWPGLLMHFDVREILHVTFGSVLKQKTVDGRPLFTGHLLQLLRANRELYFDNLVQHFRRHLEPFSVHRVV